MQPSFTVLKYTLTDNFVLIDLFQMQEQEKPFYIPDLNKNFSQKCLQHWPLVRKSF